MLNTEKVSKESIDALSGIIWFMLLTPVAMGMYFLAKYYEIIWYTIMGWFVTTLAAIQLGFGLARGGKRLFKIPITVKIHNDSKIPIH